MLNGLDDDDQIDGKIETLNQNNTLIGKRNNSFEDVQQRKADIIDFALIPTSTKNNQLSGGIEDRRSWDFKLDMKGFKGL